MEKIAEKKTKTSQEVNKSFDKTTEEKVRSKTTDQAIAKTFKLDELLAQNKPKPKPRRRFIPRINGDGGVDYAPEVDPYEDMNVEGLLNLEDYVVKKKKMKKMKKKTKNLKVKKMKEKLIRV